MTVNDQPREFDINETLTVEDIVNAAPAQPSATREQWLTRAIEVLRPHFGEAAEVDVPKVRVSVGWPGGGSKNTRVGECWAGATSADNVAQVFVSPLLNDSVFVLGVLIHEVIHAIDDCRSGHRGEFARIAKAVGLEGKMTSTTVGEALTARLEGVVATIGDYPHSPIRLPGVLIRQGPGSPESSPEDEETEVRTSGPAKQGTRMLKVECADGSGFHVRMTRKWIDSHGTPLCPCHQAPMAEA